MANSFEVREGKGIGTKEMAERVVNTVRIEKDVVINRPVEEVFAYSSNPENYVKWEVHCRGSEITSEGPLGVGTTFTDEVQFLGRRIKQIFEITEYEPNRKVSFKSISGPMGATGSFTYESVEGGTKVTVVGESDPRGLWRLIKPIMAREGKKEWESSLATLKDLLEETSAS
ncbi:MAG: SRPBCC family protein [Thermoplasmata archaeon]